MQMEKKYSFAMSYQIISFKLAFFFNSTGRARGCNSYIFPGPETFYGKKSTTSNLKVRHRKLNCDGWSILDGDFKVYTVKK